MKSSIKNDWEMAHLVQEESLHLIYRVSRYYVTSSLRENIIYFSTRHRSCQGLALALAVQRLTLSLGTAYLPCTQDGLLDLLDSVVVSN
jgi:hypothetical protein